MAYTDEYDPNATDSGQPDQGGSYNVWNPPPGFIWSDQLQKFVPNGNAPNGPAINPLTGQPYTSLAPAPGATGPTLPATPPPASSGGGLPTLNGRVTDPAVIRQYVDSWAGLPDADPTLKNNPDYAVQRIIQTGGLGSDNTGYWQDAFVGPKAFYKNPNRESGGDTAGKTVDTGSVDPSNWFSANSPAAASYSTLARPDALAQPYQPAKWSETFNAPTSDDLLKDPGYQAGADLLQKGLERGAAAKGSILSGGFAGIAEPRALANYAGTAYQNLFGRAYDTYQQRYSQFRDAQSADMAARGINESSYQTDVGNNQNQYLNRYNAYQDAIKNNFNLAQLGLNATNAGSPGTPI